MLTGTHAIIFAQDPDAARAFFRDVLEFPNVDAHEGWLIFKLPPAELGIHPTDAADGGGGASDAAAARHEIYLMCDDIEATVTQLKAKGAEFAGGVENAGFGLIAHLLVPGAGEIGIYQPRHPVAYNL